MPQHNEIFFLLLHPSLIHHCLLLMQGDWAKHHGANKDLLYVIEPVIESLLQVSSFHLNFSFYSYFHFHFPLSLSTLTFHSHFHFPLSHAIEPVIESLLQVNSFHFHFSFHFYFTFHFQFPLSLSYVIEPVIECLFQLLVQSVLVYVVLGPSENEDDWRRTEAGEERFC